MTKEDFINAVAEQVDGIVKDAEKANGVKRKCIVVNVGANISPSIHIEDMYDEGYTVDQAVKEIEEIKAQPLPNISIDAMTDYNVVKGNLRLRLYNEKTKADVFRSAADYGFDDLILVPYIQLDRGMAAKVNQSLESALTYLIILQWHLAGITLRVIQSTKRTEERHLEIMVAATVQAHYHMPLMNQQ